MRSAYSPLFAVVFFPSVSLFSLVSNRTVTASQPSSFPILVTLRVLSLGDHLVIHAAVRKTAPRSRDAACRVTSTGETASLNVSPAMQIANAEAHSHATEPLTTSTSDAGVHSGRTPTSALCATAATDVAVLSAGTTSDTSMYSARSSPSLRGTATEAAAAPAGTRNACETPSPPSPPSPLFLGGRFRCIVSNAFQRHLLTQRRYADASHTTLTSRLCGFAQLFAFVRRISDDIIHPAMLTARRACGLATVRCCVFIVWFSVCFAFQLLFLRLFPFDSLTFSLIF